MFRFGTLQGQAGEVGPDESDLTDESGEQITDSSGADITDESGA